MNRTAKWIWRDRGVAFPVSSLVGAIDPKLDSNLFVQFRRSLGLDAVPESAPLRISADGRYELFVNGTYVGRGPARCDPLYQYYDEYDIASGLRSGENVVAVLVHTYGRDMSWYQLPRTDWSRVFGCGGLFVESTALPGLNSTDRWRYTVSEAWQRDVPAGGVGFVELNDARRAGDAWTVVDFDDAAWQPAIVLAVPGIGIAGDAEPFPHLVPRDVPPLLEEPRNAQRIVSVAEVSVFDRDDLITIASALLQPLSTCSVTNPDACLTPSGAATEVRVTSGRAATMVIDFGRTVAGYPALDVDGPAGATVDVSYAERLRADGRAEVQAPNVITSQNVHRYILRDGPQSWEKFERAGFRYLQLTICPPPGQREALVHLRHVGVNFTSYPVGDRGSFACSDEALTRIWRAGAYTLQLCMQDGFEDCPSREQRQWVGDAYVESLVNYACFGDTKLTAKLIRQVAQSQRRDGITQMATPSDLAAGSGMYIVDYCLLWIMTVGEYVLHTGDLAIIDDVLPNIARAVSWFENYIDEDSLLVEPPGWIFIDWSEVDKRGASTALNALLVGALLQAAWLAQLAGVPTFSSRWTALADRISDTINRSIWDEQRGVYADARLGDGQSRRVSQHANAALIAFDIAPRDRWPRMLDYVTDTSRLVTTHSGFFRRQTPIDEERQVVLAQPYFTHFVHRALAAAGRHDEVVENIRARWLPMLGEDGTGTFWEHWHGEQSRCHAWSATPVYDLSREVLGVRPLSPGFGRFRVQPRPGALEWCGGVYPSVRGDIHVAWRNEGSRLTLEVEVPPGSEAEVALPIEPSRITLDGSPIDAQALTALKPGRHSIVAEPE